MLGKRQTEAFFKKLADKSSETFAKGQYTFRHLTVK